MVVAFVLVNAELGFEEEVLKEALKVEGVKEAHLLYGLYDLIIKVEAESVDKIKSIVNNKIRKLEKIRSTLTMISS
ncbi:MAG: Lrp/AsnC family transcriptional regulator [Candidatus Bathyarchaeia archaeon]